MRARMGTMPSSSSSKMVRRYISVVSIMSLTGLASHPSLAPGIPAQRGGSTGGRQMASSFCSRCSESQPKGIGIQ